MSLYRNRRKKRKIESNSLLKLISQSLFIILIFALLCFIFSFIKHKNSVTKNNAEFVANVENQSDNTSSDEKLNTIESNNDEQKKEKEKEDEKKENIKEKEKQQPITINMSFTGDIMCHNTIYNDAFNETNQSYDFSYIFENLRQPLQTPDITVGNLETTFAGAEKKYSSYPTFNTPEDLAYTLKKFGFDVVSTANNHCYDKGYSGIESTIKYLDEADISHTGTYTSEENQNKILIKNVKGIQIAFLSFTYGTNGIQIPSDKKYSVNLTDEQTILKQLNLAKAHNPDLICVSIHWGNEYQTTPNSEQKKLADLLFSNGADIIIGNHPHVLQPMEKRQITQSDGSSKDVFVAYSLGNFLADQNKKYTRCSAILNLKITKENDKKLHINSVTYTPTYIYNSKQSTSKNFKLIDLKNVVTAYDSGYTGSFTQQDYSLFSSELNNVKKLLGNEIK